MSVGAPKSHLRALRDQLVDIAVDRYIDWREHARTAEAAYERWTKAPVPQRPLAFGAYRAALDHEEHAAGHYAPALEAVEHALTRGSDS
jgi:hypothetical protein